MKHKLIRLNNGAKIYCFGKPDLFIMSGVHGEEIAGVRVLKDLIKEGLKYVWVLPCLNIEGYNQNNRWFRGINLNEEFKYTTNVSFLKELLEVLKTNQIKLFLDLHEDSFSAYDYVWTSHKNSEPVETKVRKYCFANNIGLLYCPDIDYYSGASETFARYVGIKNAYTSETSLYKNLDSRIKTHEGIVKFYHPIILFSTTIFG